MPGTDIGSLLPGLSVLLGRPTRPQVSSAIGLRAPYAMSGTDFVYRAIRSTIRLCETWLLVSMGTIPPTVLGRVWRCPVLTLAIATRWEDRRGSVEALPGTHIAYCATGQRDVYAMPGTDIAYGRRVDNMDGEVTTFGKRGYAATRALCDARYSHSVSCSQKLAHVLHRRLCCYQAREHPDENPIRRTVAFPISCYAFAMRCPVLTSAALLPCAIPGITCA
eukprot:3809319-Rhodomonas_salina.1